MGIQDTNANNELDTGWFGIPSEGYFTSNNQTFPDWEDCRFEFTGEDMSFELEIIYW